MESDSQTDKKIAYLLTHKYDGDKNAAEKDIEKLKNGERFEYVLGWTYFCGKKIDLSLRTFIPRQKGQQWVWDAVQEIKSARGSKPISCLDPYAGSGCIGLVILLELPNATVDFLDIDQRALEQTKINLKLHQIPPSRYSLIHADNLQKLDKNYYNYIVANPPYIPLSRQQEVMPYVLAHEPHMALFGGDDGLLYIRPLITEAKRILKSGGKLWTETGHWHKESGLENLLKNEGYAEVFWKKDNICISAEKPHF